MSNFLWFTDVEIKNNTFDTKRKAPVVNGINTHSISGILPPENGDWVINNLTIVENEELIINGSIKIEENGTLILKNSTIYMNPTRVGEHKILVLGGNLTIINSRITAYNVSYRYYIRVEPKSKLRIENSIISYAGYTYSFRGEESGLWVSTDNVTIANSIFNQCYIGIVLWSANHINIINNVIKGILAGILVVNSFNITISNNSLIESGYAIYINISSNVTVINNRFYNNFYALRVEGESYNIGIIKNQFIDDSIWISSPKSAISTFKIQDNYVNNLLVEFYFDTINLTIRDKKTGEIILAYCENAVLQNITASAFMLCGVINANVINCSLTKGDRLLGIYYSRNLNIERNIMSNGSVGISIENCLSANISISWNNISDHYVGIFAREASHITIMTNIIANNAQGIILIEADSVYVYLNNILDNEIQARDYGANLWDNGRVGNYWTDYEGYDKDNNHIGDSPYEIDINSKDRYPLMYPFKRYIFDKKPPTIYSIERHPTEPTDKDKVTITAIIYDEDSGIYHVILSYYDGNTWRNTTMLYNYTQGVYFGIIPAMPSETEIKYKIYAIDNMINVAVSQIYSYVVAKSKPSYSPLSYYILILVPIIISTSILLYFRGKYIKRT